MKKVKVNYFGDLGKTRSMYGLTLGDVPLHKATTPSLGVYAS